MGVASGVAECVPELGDRRLERRFRDELAGPHRCEDLLLRKDLVRVLREDHEQIADLRSKVDVVPSRESRFSAGSSCESPIWKETSRPSRNSMRLM